MRRDRAADTQGTPDDEFDVTADLIAEANRMALEGSDLPTETAPSTETPSSERVTSEASAASIAPRPEGEVQEEPDGFEAARARTKSRLDGSTADVAAIQGRLAQAEQERDQWQKSHREAQSFGDRRVNDVTQELAATKAQVEELNRQLQAANARSSDVTDEDDDLFGGSTSGAARAPVQDPEISILRARLDEIQNRDADARAQVEVAAAGQQRHQRLMNLALLASREIYLKPASELTQTEQAEIKTILNADVAGDSMLVLQHWGRASAAAEADRLASVRVRAAKSRVISEAGTSSSSGSLADDVDDAFKDLDFDTEGLAAPAADEKVTNALIIAAGRMARQPA